MDFYKTVWTKRSRASSLRLVVAGNKNIFEMQFGNYLQLHKIKSPTKIKLQTIYASQYSLISNQLTTSLMKAHSKLILILCFKKEWSLAFSWDFLFTLIWQEDKLVFGRIIKNPLPVGRNWRCCCCRPPTSRDTFLHLIRLEEYTHPMIVWIMQKQVLFATTRL